MPYDTITSTYTYIFSYLKLPPPASKELGHKKANHETDHSREFSNMFFRHFHKLLIPTARDKVKPIVYHIYYLLIYTYHLWYSRPSIFNMNW